jgi:hypothetical protein
MNVVDKSFQNVIHINKSIEVKKAKIISLKKDLTDFEKNPNFYRNKKIIAIAASVAILAAVIIGSAFTLGLAFFTLYNCVVTLSPFGPAAFFSSPLAAIPLLGLIPFIHQLSNVFRSYEKDLKILNTLQKEKATQKQQRASEIALMQSTLQLYNKATTQDFNEDTWEAMKKVLNKPNLENIEGEEKKKLIWGANQEFLEHNKERLVTQLKTLRLQA